MTNVTNELLYEVLKSMQADIAGLKHDVRELRQDNISIRSQIHVIQGDINELRAGLVIVNQRLDRIERRLDLHEMAEAGVPFLHQA